MQKVKKIKKEIIGFPVDCFKVIIRFISSSTTFFNLLLSHKILYLDVRRRDSSPNYCNIFFKINEVFDFKDVEPLKYVKNMLIKSEFFKKNRSEVAKRFPNLSNVSMKNSNFGTYEKMFEKRTSLSNIEDLKKLTLLELYKLFVSIDSPLLSLKVLVLKTSVLVGVSTTLEKSDYFPQLERLGLFDGCFDSESDNSSGYETRRFQRLKYLNIETVTTSGIEDLVISDCKDLIHIQLKNVQLGLRNIVIKNIEKLKSLEISEIDEAAKIFIPITSSLKNLTIFDNAERVQPSNSLSDMKELNIENLAMISSGPYTPFESYQRETRIFLRFIIDRIQPNLIKRLLCPYPLFQRFCSRKVEVFNEIAFVQISFALNEFPEENFQSHITKMKKVDCFTISGVGIPGNFRPVHVELSEMTYLRSLSIVNNHGDPQRTSPWSIKVSNCPLLRYIFVDRAHITINNLSGLVLFWVQNDTEDTMNISISFLSKPENLENIVCRGDWKISFSSDEGDMISEEKVFYFDNPPIFPEGSGFSGKKIEGEKEFMEITMLRIDFSKFGNFFPQSSLLAQL